MYILRSSALWSRSIDRLLLGAPCGGGSAEKMRTPSVLSDFKLHSEQKTIGPPLWTTNTLNCKLGWAGSDR